MREGLIMQKQLAGWAAAGAVLVVLGGIILAGVAIKQYQLA